MSSSSDEGEPFQLRDYDEDTDDERPNKRRKTMRPLRGKGIGFVSSAAQANNEEQDEDEEDEEANVDDDRPTMGLGTGMGMGMAGSRGGFNIGEYSGQAERSPTPDRDETLQEQQRGGTGPSAFSAGGKLNKNSFAARMMAKQGYVEGQGLGKSGQGIAAPIQAVGTAQRAGLGAGTAPPQPPRKQQKEKGKLSKPSTPGTSTPKLKAPPKTKYTVAAIESRGLHIPDAIKSVIIDATGAENKTVSSLSGFSTPTREGSPSLESSKASSRIKLQLQAYAEAWDSTADALSRLEVEETQLATSLEFYSSELDKYNSLITAFERVSADDSSQPRPWTDVVVRLQQIQEIYSSYIEDLELPSVAISCLEAPFRAKLGDWDPLNDPAHFTNDLRSLASILDIEKSVKSPNAKRTTPYSSLLLTHWYPHIRSSLKTWSIYNPDPTYTLLTTWQPLLPQWLTYKFLSELITLHLMSGVQRFPKLVYNFSNGIGAAKREAKSKPAPDLHSWLFDWWSLLSSPDLDLELFPQLRSAVKEKVTAATWSYWKPLLGSAKKLAPTISTPKVSTPTATAANEEISFKEIVEEWCAENNLMMKSTNKSDAFGRLLYRLQDAERRSRGILVYLLEDVIFSEDGQPFGLDEVLLEEATRRK